MPENIVQSIFARARERGGMDDPALLSDAHPPISYRQLEQSVIALSNQLPPVDAQLHPLRIGLSCPSGWLHVVAALAILHRGHCLVPIADELTSAERRDLQHRTHLNAILATEDAPSSLSDQSFQISDLAKQENTQSLSWHPCTHDTTPNFPEDQFWKLHPAFIRFSSGTTGTSKGIVLSHHSLQERITAANTGLQITPQDRILWVLPMAHHFAVSLVLYLYHGAASILATRHLGADLLKVAREHQATVLYASPFHHHLLAKACEKEPSVPGGREIDRFSAAQHRPRRGESAGKRMAPQRSQPKPPADENLERKLPAGEGSQRKLFHLRLAVSTASALTADTAELFQAQLGLPLTQGLGIIEMGLPVLNLEQTNEHPTALGQTLPPYQSQIQNGELLLKGPGMLDAYLSPWTPRDEILKDGWLHTGDLVRQDPHRSLTLQGRKKSVINVAGMKVFPEEVEAALNTHPQIHESIIKGKAHPQLGQVPVAQYVLDKGATSIKKTELVKHLKAKLSAYKIPMQFEQVDAIEKTASGKLKRA